jgi:prepilin-type N-terminal cleavage/methylation domain-containing protein
MKKAFTLAEVLITLGIIGVVAAITIPTLVNKYKAHVLKTQFKKSYATMTQAVQQAGVENGLLLGQYCIEWGTSYYNSPECFAMVKKYINSVGQCSYSSRPLNYSKTTQAYADIMQIFPSIKLADGSCVALKVNADKFTVSVDINGDKRGPNALGHDIFGFYVPTTSNTLVPFKQNRIYSEEELEARRNQLGIEKDVSLSGITATISWYLQMGYPCNKDDTRRGNGLGCSWYALNDVSPDYPSKGYFESLPK